MIGTQEAVTREQETESQKTMLVPPWYFRALKAARLETCTLDALSGEVHGRGLTYRWVPEGNLIRLEIDLHLQIEEDEPRLNPLRFRLEMDTDDGLIFAGQSNVEEVSSQLARAQFYVCRSGVFRIRPV